ncbi:HNH endonuclease [Anabaena cylindrica FACHB-243]|uniref:HNH endonuclease n=1 Tax=Anabaena cylindrica (strain ATCC 27899 / PCC 7122) TaxID=272123 RepID=K9ZJI0_ANACC|nr:MULTISPECIES: HNH endonuclease signature motif containing protein [Anabaena]AFZ59361.1 HNH endonuclease [Anabaena cylindrica PCC 7122]MBD2416779.1 HNH endonuclease [Anabaena cylindrica FACHB-243]MBY5280255.1 HNH endonuclease [Anabaena sp. CCAP 1446/1C]MBY5308527.1 HNH endonuclease [Anabaena sp. CCAP 1446/1C]MCM2405279.1 HNH endonuclease [Anabaena sp. CCAP 1446/1C]
MTIDDITRELVRKRAKYLCEYCHSPERISTTRFTLDHVIPKSLGGADDIDNLALACRRCNERRYNFLAGIDPETQAITPLFNPLQQKWSDHFIWSADGKTILGTTPTGRATCKRLDINDERYTEDDSIRSARGFWVKAALHPPDEDPRQVL